MTHPLAILTISYCLGIAFVNYARVGFWFIFSAAILMLILLIFARGKKHVFCFLVLMACFIFGALNLKNTYFLPGNHIFRQVGYQDNMFYNLKGFIANQPEINNEKTSFIFRVQELQERDLSIKSSGKILVNLGFPRSLAYGDSLRLSGKLRRPMKFGSRGNSYRNYLYNQGVYFIMQVKSPLEITELHVNQGYALVSKCLWLRDRIEGIIAQYLAPLPAGILAAMVLGERKNIPRLVNNSMVKSGTVHILVVSGFNVGVVAFSMNLLLKIIRLPRKIRVILAAICLLLYCLITGASNPVVRATVMGVFILFAYLFQRQPDIYNSLAAAALFILIMNPRQLFDVGFALSFASVLSIVCLYPRLRLLLRIQRYKSRILIFVFESLLVSFSAWIGTLGIILYNFGLFTPVTVLANIFIVPLATLITLSGFSLVLCAALFPASASYLGVTTSFLITLLLKINALVVKLPFAYRYI